MPARITLHPIDSDNWRSVTRLKPLSEQEAFVAPNWYSIIQASFEGGEAMAIHADEGLVGFTWYVFDEGDRAAHIHRLMIDPAHQGRGYGRAALSLIFERARSVPFVDTVFISFVPENIVARGLYESVGFTDTGEVDDGELIFRMSLR